MKAQTVRFTLYHAIHNHDIAVFSDILDECRRVYGCKNADLYKLANTLTGISKEGYQKMLAEVDEFNKCCSKVLSASSSDKHTMT